MNKCIDYKLSIIFNKGGGCVSYGKGQRSHFKAQAKDSKAFPVLWPAKIEGFVPITDKDFDLIREATRAAGAL